MQLWQHTTGTDRVSWPATFWFGRPSHLWRVLSQSPGHIVCVVLLAALLTGCASPPREPVALVVPDYGFSIALADTRWQLAEERSFEHDHWGRYYWIDIPDRANEADLQITLQHVADVPADLPDLPSWSAAVLDIYLDLYTGGYAYEQLGDTRTATVALASGQDAVIAFRTYTINGHIREVAIAALEEHGVRVFLWLANEGRTAPLEALAPEALRGVVLAAPGTVAGRA